ncbi:MAG TPA: TIGR03557 family F420-dependent LLM class oxidoreductase [Dehalococcoidia bacterium]|nr:TIGR03557 family F420-dependent LLM class oxidoreductase [Dehalococcoidia bacterium]
MTEFGYALSSEQHPPSELVQYARRAEETGFEFVMISDHYHPWIDRQGHAPFAWAVLGGVASVTKRIRVGTGVTCPIMRIHPAIIAQAAATVASMMPGRFFLGVGTGENLNEHILGDGWPSIMVRREMLEEAVEVIRELWTGEDVEFYGEYFNVEHARIYDVPDPVPPIYVAAAGKRSAELAGAIGDGFISTGPLSEVVGEFESERDERRPKYAEVTVSYDEDEARARKVAHDVWPNAGVPGELSQELPLPRHFEQASRTVTEDEVAKVVACGPDPERYVQMIRKYEDAGFDHLYLHNVAADQEKFFRFCERELLPRLGSGDVRQRGAA